MSVNAANNVWALNPPAHNTPATETTLLNYKNPLRPHETGTETVFETDARERVKLTDLQPGGVYRSIIKLFCRYENQAPDDRRRAIGTGWLIRPDLLVTAGHCAYDWNNGLGRAVEIKAYLGYHGKDEVDYTGNVQFRYGKKVATSVAWLTDRRNKNGDLSLVQLEKPFTNVVPFTYQSTPLVGTIKIGVVGYPGDKEKNGEKGAEMYEMFAPVDFDRNKSDLHMLDYPISTYAGQSGSPVLAVSKSGQFIPIAIHTYGGTSRNSATPIGGPDVYGNRLEEYIDLIDNRAAPNIPNPNSNGLPNGGRPGSETGTEGLLDNTEGFLDILKDVAKIALPIGKTILSVAPIAAMGPVGSVLAPIAGIALDAAGKLTESGFGTESTLISDLKDSGRVNRAILGEAALGTVLKLDPETLQQEGLLDDMKTFFNKHRGLIKQVAPAIRSAILEPGFRISLEVGRQQAAEVQKLKNGDLPSGPPPKRVLPQAESLTEGQFDGNAERFIRGIVREPTAVIAPENDTEFSFGDIFNVIKTGISTVAPIVNGVAKVVAKVTESGLEDTTRAESATKTFDTLAYRSLMGEAALQALMKKDAQFLGKARVENEFGQTESIFSSIKNIIQKVAPTVIKALPHVINTVAPIVSGLVAGKSESGFGRQPSGGSLAVPERTPARKRSMNDIFEATIANGASHTSRQDVPVFA